MSLLHLPQKCFNQLCMYLRNRDKLSLRATCKKLQYQLDKCKNLIRNASFVIDKSNKGLFYTFCNFIAKQKYLKRLHLTYYYTSKIYGHFDYAICPCNRKNKAYRFTLEIDVVDALLLYLALDNFLDKADHLMIRTCFIPSDAFTIKNFDFFKSYYFNFNNLVCLDIEFEFQDIRSQTILIGIFCKTTFNNLKELSLGYYFGCIDPLVQLLHNLKLEHFELSSCNPYDIIYFKNNYTINPNFQSSCIVFDECTNELIEFLLLNLINLNEINFLEFNLYPIDNETDEFINFLRNKLTHLSLQIKYFTHYCFSSTSKYIYLD